MCAKTLPAVKFFGVTFFSKKVTKYYATVESTIHYIDKKIKGCYNYYLIREIYLEGRKPIMKLLFIFTGGTIGSTKRNDVISTDENKSYMIIDAYRSKYGIDFDYDAIEPYVELSENNTGRHIRMLVNAVTQNQNKGYDGIIVTHGSDTLQYSAAAIGYCIGLNSLPICLVAANLPIEDSRSNALDNLHGAIKFIEGACGRGAFVIYRNASSDTVKAHRATRLIGAKAYSDDSESVGGIAFGYFDKNYNFIKNPDYTERADEAEPLDATLLGDISREIVVISPYPGMIYPQISDGVKYVVLNTYHSGTLNTKAENTIDFLNKARERGIDVYASGTSCGARYLSADCFDLLNIIPINSISPVAAYIKLWLITSMGEDSRTLMSASIGGDIA